MHALVHAQEEKDKYIVLEEEHNDLLVMLAEGDGDVPETPEQDTSADLQIE